MTSERYTRLQELFERAAPLRQTDREALLANECSEDPDLRRAVEALLANDLAKTALPKPLRTGELASKLGLSLVGRTIRHYRIERELGRGGMGVVYRAEDLNLGRPVALKFLAPHLAGETEFTKRFLREARAAATLDHPNICTVYETGDSEAGPFIAMAFLEGETLRSHMERGPLPIREALEYATQAAMGLEAAHRRGVVHRDIKPENLMVSPPTTGTGAPLVRVLDFGVARTAEEALTQGSSTPGTIAYMAPEQITSTDADERCDVWALGVVLFEMVAGRKPFRASAGGLAGAILHTEQDPLTALRSDVPLELERIVNKALSKSPERRYQGVTDLIVDLTALRAGLDSGTHAVRRAAAEWRGTGPWLLAAGALACVAAAVWLWNSSADAPPVFTARPLTHYVGDEEQPAISHDGRQVAFIWDGEEGSGDGDLYVQLVGSANPLRLTRTPEREHSPTWSPDGKRIAFMRRAQNSVRHSIVVIDALGGPETEMGETWQEGARGMDWSPDGKHLAYPVKAGPDAREGPDGLALLNVDDRSLAVLTRSPENARTVKDESPKFSPDGSRIAFVSWNSGLGEVRIRSLEGEESEVVATGSIRYLAWAADGGSLLCATGGGSSSKLQRIRLLDGSVADVPLSESDVREMDLRGGLLAFTSWRVNTAIWSAGLSQPHGQSPRMAKGAAHKLITSTRRQDSPQFSPDGSTIAFVSDRSGSDEIWTSDKNGGSLRQLTSLGNVGSPQWSPDGRWIAFDSAGPNPGNVDVYVVSAKGGESRRLTRASAQDRVPSWSRDGKWIYFGSNRTGARRVWKAPAEGGAPVQVTKQRGFEAIESADGKRLYYSIGTHRAGLWSLDLESGEEGPVPELAEAGFLRYWASSDTALYFINAQEVRSPDNTWEVHRLDYRTGNVDLVGLFEGELDNTKRGLAVSPDDSSLLFTTVEIDDRDIMLVEGFE